MMMLVAAPVESAQAAPADARLAAVKSWAFAIGGDPAARAARLRGFGLVVVDGEQVTARQVARLRSGGALVLAYLDAGTIEPWRGWYPRARRYRLGLWGDWGEWYADVARRGLRDLLVREVAPQMLAKGVDGLFLDNVDMIETHPGQRAGMRVLVTRLAGLAHRRGGLLFAQNGAAVIGPMLGLLDGWNREDVGFTYDFGRHQYRSSTPGELATAQRELRAIAARGLLTLATSYSAGGAATQSAAAEAACAAGALPFVSNIGLTRVGPPLTCG
jgi:hypothetical protein